MESKFKELSVIDCGEYIETIPQGNRKLSYISWSDAWQLLKEKCPDANYEHHEPVTFPNGEMMVFCTVTVNGVSHRMHLPVLGNKNQPLKNPNVFDINTSMQRCFAKAISMHGLGLYVYRGEDCRLLRLLMTRQCTKSLCAVMKRISIAALCGTAS